MKVFSTIKPEKILIHVQSRDKNLSLVRFRENIVSFTKVSDFGEINGYEYDEYVLEMPTSTNLEININSNYNFYLSQAKRNDKELMNKINEYILKGWITQNEINEYLINNLDIIKKIKIFESKYNLDNYLKLHPLQWTDNKYYTITFDKTQQLTSKLLSATFAQQTGTPYDLKWNDTEQVCEPWTLENLTALAFAIDARVTALVTYQQEKERQIRDAETLEKINSIIIDYDEVKQE